MKIFDLHLFSDTNLVVWYSCQFIFSSRFAVVCYNGGIRSAAFKMHCCLCYCRIAVNYDLQVLNLYSLARGAGLA